MVLLQVGRALVTPTEGQELPGECGGALCVGTVMLTVMVGFGLVQSVRVHRYSEVTSGRGALL